MKAKIIFFAFMSMTISQVHAQNVSLINNWYRMSASEFIFSGAQVKSGGITLPNVVRFSVFFNYQSQAHYNFSNSFGLYTGFGVRNVGFINKLAVDAVNYATLKQRSYSFGIPLALKFGDMSRGFYFAPGVEAEFMFAYKEKVLYNDQKFKNYEWFSDKVNIFNPSVFADIRFPHGSYIRLKYYLLDFLTPKGRYIDVPTLPYQVYYQPQSSKLFYISVGTSFRDRKFKKHHALKEEL